ncbi:MAG: hypothetical protein P4L67_00760 [Candidatus Pacebacteria bacterium]|nr:hypothetical protein [Candidatus Paceibacterota bacterium]
MVATDRKRKGLTEYEQALLAAHTKLKELEDKVDERQAKIGLYGPSSKELIRTHPICSQCEIGFDVELRELFLQTEQAVKDLDHALNPLRKERMKHVPAFLQYRE